jgi:hypothetical protein
MKRCMLRIARPVAVVLGLSAGMVSIAGAAIAADGAAIGNPERFDIATG